MANDVPSACWRDRIQYYFGRRRAFQIDGDSMSPTLASGEKVLIGPAADLKIGDIVLAEHPYKMSVRIIKRIEKIADGGVSIVGDNPGESTDSRAFGAVSIESIIGRVVCRLN